MNGFFLIQLFSIMSGVVLGVLFGSSSLAKYDLQIIAALFIIYFFLRKRINQSPFLLLFESNIFIFIIISVVFTNGGLNSPFFFLLYFLLFASAVVLDSSLSLILTLILVVVFLITAPANTQLKDLLPVFSLPLIAPFAKYLGDMQKRSYYHKQEINKLSKAKEKVEKLKGYGEAQTLIFLTTVLRRHLDDLEERLNNFLGDEDLRYLKTKTEELKSLCKQFQEYIEKI